MEIRNAMNPPDPLPTPLTDAEELRTSQDSLMSDEANIGVAYDFARALERHNAELLRVAQGLADELRHQMNEVRWFVRRYS